MPHSVEFYLTLGNASVTLLSELSFDTVGYTWEETARPWRNQALSSASRDELMDKVDPIVVPHRNSVNGRFRPG